MGQRLPTEDFERRHRLMSWAMAAQFPSLLFVAVRNGEAISPTPGDGTTVHIDIPTTPEEAADAA